MLPARRLCVASRAAGDPGWLSWSLAAEALAVLADSVRPSRRALAPVGALLLSASGWVRLASAGVHAPEPYVLPVALIALGLGHLRRRRQPATRSLPAYGPGLSAGFGPSLLVALGDPGLARPLLLGAAALATVLIGARWKMQAPILIGALVLAVDAISQIAPYAAAVPRWVSLGAAGALLVVVGATYERRRRDLTRLRERFATLS